MAVQIVTRIIGIGWSKLMVMWRDVVALHEFVRRAIEGVIHGCKGRRWSIVDFFFLRDDMHCGLFALVCEFERL